MPIGSQLPSEWKTYTDPRTGRAIKQFTTAQANSYPLYYFIPSITPDGKTLIFHSERSGWVQLYKMDLNSGDMTQLTEGRTRDSGWAMWCEQRLRGIYNHLSALNGVRREVYYFQDEEVRCTQIDSLENRLVQALPGRISIGQTGFSPDGRLFAFIHAEREMFSQAIADREAIRNMGRPFDHNAWRNDVPATVSIIDTDSGAYQEVVKLDFHVHHVFFIDNKRLLINHVQGENGMWIINIDGSGRRQLRSSREGQGAVCHQVITERGILYEANARLEGQRAVWFGHYKLEDDTFEEVRLPGVGYVHTGYEPAGRFLFIENQLSDRHELLSVHYPDQPERLQLRLIHALNEISGGQRYHAHPFLAPDRQWLFYTEVIEGFSQVCAIEVSDLVDLDEYWPGGQ